MIQLEIDTSQLTENLNNLAAGLEEIISPQSLDAISEATFSITGQRFMVAVDNYARMNPKKMHHVYEWGKIGNKTARLFILERSVIINGNLIINAKFLPSKMPVPISKQLLIPGSSGKVVSKKSIFANKAEVMEAGTPISFNAKRVLAMAGNNGIAFIAPGTQINIMHPGGIQTKHSFASYMLEWYSKNAGAIMDASGIYENLSNGVAKVFKSKNYSPSEVVAVVKEISQHYSIGAIIK